MWGNTIGSRVKKILNFRIKQAQKEHDEECAVLDQRHDEAVSASEMARDDAKESHASTMVDRILSGK